jgi:excisionase family DNA binding protein
MKSSPMSTEQVAQLLQVTETTIKRWADEGKISCSRTPGGHRKFMLADVVRFAEEHALPLNGALPAPGAETEQLRNALLIRNYSPIIHALEQAALRADRARISELFLTLARNQIPFPVIVDNMIRPALASVGAAWIAGKLEIHQEHRATHALMESLPGLFRELHRKPANGLTAVCACAPGEHHDLGLRSLAYALELEGWHVHYLGADTPFKSIESCLRKVRPDLLCLSVTAPTPPKQLMARVHAIGKAAASIGTTVMLGGYSVADSTPGELACHCIASSIQEAIGFLRDRFALKPGPKTKLVRTPARK